MMKHRAVATALFALALLAAPAVAFAQGAPNARAMTVGSCGVQTFPLLDPSGKQAFAPLTQLQNGNLCTNGTGGGGGGSGGAITGPLGPSTTAPNSVATTFGSGTTLPAFAAPPTVLLGAGTNAIGSITNTAFGISGTLPAFASTPTFNLGNSIPAGSNAIGSVSVSNFPATQPVSGTVQLGAGSAKVGIVTTDQTTHGTTDKVAADLYVGGTPVSATNPSQVIGEFQYNNTLQNYTPGGLNYIQSDLRGHTKTSEAGSSDPLVGIVPNSGSGATCTNAATTGCIAKNAQGNLYRAYATATSAPAAQQYLVCINAASVPTTGSTLPANPDYAPFNLATTAGSTASINFGPGPPSGYSTGIVCLISTSLTTYTAGTASFINTGVR